MSSLEFVIVISVLCCAGLMAAHLYYKKYGDGVVFRLY